MHTGCLFSQLEFYVTSIASRIVEEKQGKDVRSLLLQEEGIIHSFMNEFASVVVATKEEYQSVVRSPFYHFGIPVVSPNWVFQCIITRCVLPYDCFSVDPFYLFSECCFYVLTSDMVHFSELVSTLQHYGGTVYYSFNDSVTHIVLTSESSFVNKEHASLTQSGIYLISEEEVFLSIENSSHLSLQSSHPFAVQLSKHLYQAVNHPRQQFSNCMFILSVSHPYEQQLLIDIITAHGGEVHTAVHSLEAHSLYLLQRSNKQTILVSSWKTAFVSDLSSLCPSLELRSPEWVYDSIGEHKLSTIDALYRPLPLLDLRHIRAHIISCHYEEYKRLAEAIGILITSLCYEYIFADTSYVQEIHNDNVQLVSFQWVLDCIKEERILPMTDYTLFH